MIFFYFLIFVMPLSRHPILGRFVAELTVVKYIGAACLLYAVFHLAARRGLPAFFRTWQARLFLLLYLIAAASYFAQGTAWAPEPFLSYTSFLLLFFITLSVVDSLHRLRSVLLVAIGSVAFGSLYVLRAWQKYHASHWAFRPGWVVGDPNYFTASALVCLPLAFCLSLERGPRWQRVYCLGCLVLALAAVTLAASRGGFLGLSAALLYVVCRSRQRLRNLALAGSLLVLMALAMPASPLTRFANPSYGDVESANNRTALWTAGLRMIRSHPLVGVGLGNFKPQVRTYAGSDSAPEGIAHNSYIETAAEMGLPALLLFLAVLYCSYRSLERVRRWSLRCGPPLLYQSALGVQAGLLGYAVAIFFLSGQYQKLFWLMVFVSVPMVSLAASVAARQKSIPIGELALPVRQPAAISIAAEKLERTRV